MIQGKRSRGRRRIERPTRWSKNEIIISNIPDYTIFRDKKKKTGFV